MLQFLVGAELFGAAFPDDLATLDDIVAVADTGQRVDVLVDDQDRLSARLQAFEALPDFLADQRR